jgi:SAM-dependent methyltransferase
MRKIDLDAEATFENRKASGEGVRSAQDKFYWATALPEADHKKLTLTKIANGSVLEIGCASGYDAKIYAGTANKYIGVDISDVAIGNCRAMNVKNAEFYCTDGHKLPLADSSVDFVIVNSLLHHLDLEIALAEISRVLTRNGRLIFKEPLGTNFAFQIYRWLTPSARTVDERPFTFADIKLIRRYFDFEEVTWYGFLSIGSAFFRSSALRIILTRTDKLLSSTPLKYFFWQFSGVARLRD